MKNLNKIMLGFGLLLGLVAGQQQVRTMDLTLDLKTPVLDPRVPSNLPAVKNLRGVFSPRPENCKSLVTSSGNLKAQLKDASTLRLRNTILSKCSDVFELIARISDLEIWESLKDRVENTTTIKELLEINALVDQFCIEQSVKRQAELEGEAVEVN